MTAEAIHLNRGFYAPRFVIEVDGKRSDGSDSTPVAPHVIRDVLEVTFEDSLDEFESFEFTLADWDPQLNAPKYSSPYDEKGAARKDGAGNAIPAFEPGMMAKLSMGYYGSEEPVVKLVGTIVTVTPSFPESGMPVVKVRVISTLFQLQHKQVTQEFVDQTDTAIAQALADELGIGVATPAGQAATETPQAFTMLNTEYPVNFLARRARLLGYDLVMLPAPPPELGLTITGGNANEPVLFFGPSGVTTPSYELAWGKTLTHFNLSVRIKDQVGTVELRATNPTKKGAERDIIAKATLDDLGLDFPDPKLLDSVKGALAKTEEVVVDQPAKTQAEADAKALGILRDRVKEMVTAEGGTIGFAQLRAGGTVAVTGIGPRFSGLWVLTKTTHRIDSSGYRTMFSARLQGKLP
jgi:phage protein D